MAKNQNTFAKIQREMHKKRKAEEKRLKRQQRKAAAEASPETDPTEHDDESEMGPE